MAKKTTNRQESTDLVEDEASKSLQQFIHLMQTNYEGPLPPPSQFKGYEEVLPGSADRILKIAEKASDTTAWVRKGELLLKYFGLTLIFAITLGSIVISGYIISKGYVWAGFGFIVVPVVGAIVAAVRNRAK